MSSKAPREAMKENQGEQAPSPGMRKPKHPFLVSLGRSLVSLTISASAVIFTGVLVNEITSGKTADWGKVWHTTTTLYVLLSLLCQVAWQLFLERDSWSQSASVRQHMDREYSKAYLRASCLDTWALAIREKARQGNLQEALKDYDDVQEKM